MVNAIKLDNRHLGYGKSLEEIALVSITIPLLKFFIFAQFAFGLFLITIGIQSSIYGIYFLTLLISIVVYFKFKTSYKILSAFVHTIVVFHGVMGVLLYGWGFGTENFLIWGIATAYLMFSSVSWIAFAIVASEAFIYVLLYIFRESFGAIDIEQYKSVVYMIVYVSIFVSFFRRTTVLNRIYFKNIAVVSKQNEELERASKIDFLTGLDNRRYTEEKFKEMRQSRFDEPVLIAIGDIDNFKRINDDFGHEVGDTIIKEIGSVLRDNSRSSKDIACRWGGEEFVLISLVVDEESANSLLNRILKRINTIKAPNGNNVGITFGAVLFDDWGELNLNDMVGIADKLLYEGKKSGKNCIKFRNWTKSA